MFIIIVFWLGSERPSRLPFFRARFSPPFHTRASLLAIFIFFFILFDYCCSHARVFGETPVHEFPISYSNTEWYFIFSRGEIVLALAEALA